VHLKGIEKLRTEVLSAGLLFARTEAIVPAPESAHAVKAAIDSAIDARKVSEERVIVFNLSGHGHFDMEAYGALMDGQLGSVPEIDGIAFNIAKAVSIQSGAK